MERLRAAWRSGRTSRPTRASGSLGCSSTPARSASPSARSARPRRWSTAGSSTSSSATRSGPKGPRPPECAALHERSSLTVGIDSTEAAGLLAAAVDGSPAGPLRVLVELDSGARRSGVAGPAEALAVARRARESGLEVDRRLHPRRPRLPRARRRTLGGRRRGGDSRRPPPTRSAPRGSPWSASPPARRRPASMQRPVRSTRSGQGPTSSATASSSSLARSRPRNRARRRDDGRLGRGSRPDRPRRRSEDADEGPGGVPRRIRRHRPTTPMPSSSGSSTTTQPSGSRPARRPRGWARSSRSSRTTSAPSSSSSMTSWWLGPGSPKVAGRSTPAAAADDDERPRPAIRGQIRIDLMRAADADAVLSIYGEGIATGNATLDTIVPTWRRVGRGPSARLPVRRPHRPARSSAGPRSRRYSAQDGLLGRCLGERVRGRPGPRPRGRRGAPRRA